MTQEERFADIEARLTSVETDLRIVVDGIKTVTDLNRDLLDTLQEDKKRGEG